MKLKWLFCIALYSLACCSGCNRGSLQKDKRDEVENMANGGGIFEDVEGLGGKLRAIADSAQGTVGIAVVTDHDTITVNNEVRFAMMSVFKLHQSLSVADKLDSVIWISKKELDYDTWSPMLKVYGSAKEGFDITVRELVKYALIVSDNNASNLLFSHIVTPIETERFVRSLVADTTFRIRYSEDHMKRNPVLSYENYTSPLSAALLIRKLFTEDLSNSINSEAQDSICHYLTVVTTGLDRLGAPLKGDEGVVFGHKTGSGYHNSEGLLMAHNDVGYFRLPDGRDYSLSVFIRDYDGNEAEASALISRISNIVFHHVDMTK